MFTTQDLWASYQGVRERSTTHKLQPKTFSSLAHGIDSVKEQDEVWVISEKTKKEKVEFSKLKFIRDFRVHSNFSVVLYLERQLDDVVNFSTNPKEFSVFGIDPTFNIFNDNISLTITTYRNLKLENPSTEQALVFLGPLLMLLKKDGKPILDLQIV